MNNVPIGVEKAKKTAREGLKQFLRTVKKGDIVSFTDSYSKKEYEGKVARVIIDGELTTGDTGHSYRDNKTAIVIKKDKREKEKGTVMIDLDSIDDLVIVKRGWGGRRNK